MKKNTFQHFGRLKFTIFYLFIFSSCAQNSLDSLPCEVQAVTYNGEVVEIMQHYCTGTNLGSCHQAGAGQPDFTEYQTLKSYIDSDIFQQRVFVQKNMPPANSQGLTKLGRCDLDKLRKWIEEGAPNN